MWSIEDIPDGDKLFMRVHDSFIKDNTIIPGAFRERGDGDLKGMSTDWSKYSTADQSQSRAKNPKENSIISLLAGSLRASSLIVMHAPEDENRSHSNVKGIDVEARLKLMGLFSWEKKSNKIT